VFSLAVWFQRERFKTLLAIDIIGHAFSFHGAVGECHESRNLMTSNGDLSICGDDKFAW
jgi:hypothetical protein